MDKDNKQHGISVIMPTYNQESFISIAIRSILLQSYINWELIIINDGSSDDTEKTVQQFLNDSRIKYFVNCKNSGLGACLNIGIDKSNYDLIAYLPSDDIYFKEHLKLLYNQLNKVENAVLVYSGIKYQAMDAPDYSNSKFALDQPLGYSVQLVQVLHKKTIDRWVERHELVTDDLYTMFWEKIMARGECIPTQQITCEWTFHVNQRHRNIIERHGGSIYKYKIFYNVKHPIRFKSSNGNFIDEIQHYESFRIKAKPKVDGLKILLVGELAYNAERICALEERGHQLYGLWIGEPLPYNAIGPFPFGNIENVPYNSWKQRISKIRPDVIYSLLNYQAVPLAHEVLSENFDIPFIWHFKEGPTYCRQLGLWDKLIDLYKYSDGLIHTNLETKEWFEQYYWNGERPHFILDGDLPSNKWFSNERSELLSQKDGEIHTVVPGRLMGLNPSDVHKMAEEKIHLHIYGDFYHSMYQGWIDVTKNLAPKHIHLHSYCSTENWVNEFSRYDAGWLHIFESNNQGETVRATWNDLNFPARMASLAMAGLPMIQSDNSGHIVATQELTKKLGIGVFFKDIEHLGEELRHKQKLKEIRDKTWNSRAIFSFDYYVDDLISFFWDVIKRKKEKQGYDVV